MLEADCEGDDKEVIMEARNTPNKLSNAEQPVTSLDGEDNFNSLQLIDLLEALSGAPLGAELLVCTDDDSPQLQEPLPNDRNLNSPASSGYQSGDDPSWFSYPDISEEPPSPPDVHEAIEPSASVESVDISSQPDDPVPATSAKANSKGILFRVIFTTGLHIKDLTKCQTMQIYIVRNKLHDKPNKLLVDIKETKNTNACEFWAPL